jgi:Domain of unknown function (DUF4260)
MSTLSASSASSGVVRDAPNLILRAEGLALLAAATVAYNQTLSEWGLYALLFFAPDVFMLGYLHSTRLGAWMYNLGHTTIVPFALIGIGLAFAVPSAVAVGLIWMAHIGFDRAVGYGLKYTDDFKHTHLGMPFSGKDESRT